MSCCGGAPCSCRVVQGPGITVTGSGSASDPFVVSGGGAGTPTPVTEADTPTIDQHVTGTGTAVDPYVVSADVKIDPVAGNLIQATPAGLLVPCEGVQDCVGAGFDDGLIYDDAANQYRVRLSTDAGNQVVFGADSGVYVPPSAGAVPLAGCGINVAPDGTVSADTLPFAALTRIDCDDDSDLPATTPLDPACELNGMAVYCDSNGQLRTMPEKFTATENTSINEAYSPAISVLPFTTSIISMTVTNPSDCYCLCGYVTFSFIAAVSGQPGTIVSLSHELDRGLGVFTGLTGYVMDNRGKTALSGDIRRPAAPLNVCLDPGETKTFRHRVLVERQPGDNGAGVLLTGMAREIRFVGSNL